MPACRKFLATVNPDGPAPTTQYRSVGPLKAESLLEKVAGFSRSG